MKLRDYQEETIAAVWQYWQANAGHWPLVVLPTGGGKTIVFSTIAKRVYESCHGARILVLAHRRELITQAADKMRTVWPDAPIGIFSAALNKRELRSVTIASRDTLKNSLDWCGTFDLIIVDEAHNIAPSEESGYRQIIGTLRTRNPSLMVLGVTATPYRTGCGFIYKTGEKGDESKLFDGLAHQVKIKTLLDAGHLCRVISRRTDSASVIHTEGLKVARGDFAIGELEAVAVNVKQVRSALNEWREVAIVEQRRKLTLFFCVSVKHAEMISAELSSMGFSVPVISGTTPAGEREQIISDAENLRIDGIANVGCLTEGTDIPPIDCIAMLRPTKSLGLYVQMIGRGMRLSPQTGKADCLLLDFGECIDRFGPIDVAQPAESRSASKRTKDCPECGNIVGFYVRKCSECRFEFSPQPHKTCPECLELNAPTAAVCCACDHVFVSHQHKSSAGAVLSDELEPQILPVQRMRAIVADAPTGEYVQVVFWTPKGPAYKALLLSAPGLAGRHAQLDWHDMTQPDTPAPRNAAHAAELLNNGAARPARFVKVPQGQPHALISVIY